MTDKVQLIKQEVERLSNEYPISRGMLKHLTIFIDSLQEELENGDLKKEISKWRNHYISVLENNLRIDLRDIEVTANHFAEWQKRKDVEEMMKTLVGGEIVKDIHNQLKVTSEPLNDTFWKFGDKVKIIIVKKN